jgi:hypothetical protein
LMMVSTTVPAAKARRGTNAGSRSSRPTNWCGSPFGGLLGPVRPTRSRPAPCGSRWRRAPRCSWCARGPGHAVADLTGRGGLLLHGGPDRRCRCCLTWSVALIDPRPHLPALTCKTRWKWLRVAHEFGVKRVSTPLAAVVRSGRPSTTGVLWIRDGFPSRLAYSKRGGRKCVSG